MALRARKNPKNKVLKTFEGNGLVNFDRNGDTDANVVEGRVDAQGRMSDQVTFMVLTDNTHRGQKKGILFCVVEVIPSYFNMYVCGAMVVSGVFVGSTRGYADAAKFSMDMILVSTSTK